MQNWEHDYLYLTKVPLTLIIKIKYKYFNSRKIISRQSE